MARILQVCNSDFFLLKLLAPLVMELITRGHTVECVCETHSQEARLAVHGAVVHHFEFPRTASPMQFFIAIQRMRRLLRDHKYDCVDSHNRNASIIARVAAWLEGVPVNLYTAHGFYFHDAQPAWMRELTVLLESVLARITHFTLSESAEDVEFVVKRGLIPQERILHIGNGIDVTRFSPHFDRTLSEKRLGLEPGRFRIATIGRIVRGKGFEDLLQAFTRFVKEVSCSELLMIGGNIMQDVHPFQREFEAKIGAAGLDEKVRITGIVDNVEEYLATADLFVLPSYREGMPRALIEAMAMGLPSIATNIRGCREIIDDGISGFLFPAGDIDALATLLLQCSTSHDQFARVGAQARKIAAEKFSESAYVLSQVTAIERLLAENARTE